MAKSPTAWHTYPFATQAIQRRQQTACVLIKGSRVVHPGQYLFILAWHEVVAENVGAALLQHIVDHGIGVAAEPC